MTVKVAGCSPLINIYTAVHPSLKKPLTFYNLFTESLKISLVYLWPISFLFQYVFFLNSKIIWGVKNKLKSSFTNFLKIDQLLLGEPNVEQEKNGLYVAILANHTSSFLPSRDCWATCQYIHRLYRQDWHAGYKCVCVYVVTIVASAVVKYRRVNLALLTL